MTHSGFHQMLEDARELLREDDLKDNKESIERLKVECLKDPMKLYRRESFRPRFVVWELTLKCNMRCAHCGSAAGLPRENELSTEEAVDVAKQLGALGCERLTLLGGEPLLRKDWEILTKALQDAGVRVNIISNGWLTADRAMMQRIKEAGLTTVALSIDGYKEKHDELRRKTGSWDRIMRTYDIANEMGGISTGAVTTITRVVLNDLENLYQTLLEKKVRLWQIQLVTPSGRLERDDPVVPSAEEVKKVAEFIVAKKKERKLRIDPADNLGYFDHWETEEGFRSTQWGRSGFWTGCQAGCQVAGVDANGDIKGCLSLPSEPQFIEGNIRTESLEQIWWKEGNFAYNRNFTLDVLGGYCKECEYRGLCRAGCVSHCHSKAGHRGTHPDCLHMLAKTGQITP